MYIIDVIPIAKGMGKDHLSYFTSQEVLPGKLVTVPVRKRTLSALVVNCESAQKRKTELKSSGFALKKIAKLHKTSFLDEGLITAARDTATYFATTPGRVLQTIIPSAILNDLSSIKKPKNSTRNTKKNLEQTKTTHEKFLLQTQPSERLAHYKSLIREDFAKDQSVFFCLPTIEDINKAKATLEKGIDTYTYVLHSNLSKNKLQEIWNEITQQNHPVLIIATPLFLSIPRNDLGTIIVEREASQSYKQQSAPFLDMRTYAEFLSRARGVRFVLGDTLLRVETLKRYHDLEFTEYMPLKYRSLTSAQTSLVDMRESVANENDEFPIISPELKELLSNALEKSELTFLFASRRGLAPITVCGDCGALVRCKYCETPVVLHEISENTEHNVFQCHKCGTTRSAHETCKSCGSWRLNALGVGVERVIESITKSFPDVTIFRIDKDNTRTHKQALSVIEKFYQTPGSVLIGTEMGILYLSEEIENIGVVSLDSLFSVPDFRINEKIINILITLRLLAQKQFLVQSRNAEQPILQHGLSGNLIDFYRQEVTVRKQFSYPPFTVLVKITRRGTQDKVEADMKWLQDTVGSDRITMYAGSPPIVKGKFVMNALIKVPREQWVDEPLLTLLNSLPPQFIIQIDPQNIL
ncbi:MAG: primosomal protein N' [Candidatus Paceibacterota bacterium]